MDESIFRIRLVVRYVRSSPARLQRFKWYVEKEKIGSKSHLILDVETRWNSTYLMLEAALKFQKAFELLALEDSKYADELTSSDRSRGLPMSTDWEYAHYLLSFLKVFYDATLRVSGSLYVTSNAYMREIIGVRLKISTWCKSPDLGLRNMATRMKVKFDKYWSNVDNINIMLFIAEVLDPRHKLEYVYWVVNEAYDVVVANKLMRKMKEALLSLFEQYNLLMVDDNEQSSEESQVSIDTDVHDVNVDNEDFMRVMYNEKKAAKKAVEHKTELDKYLADDCEDDNDKTFDILNW
ncbi:zinc finger BED domain-containing protein RICESLEEPER 2-like [Pistacia vera]|uniref:zinc finger BED domain-containing protein RICESLEEPER 2-like n=1 Tax=Pistacia vera TaxID=55513 RepID=UPI001262DDED|nr:zinc finger BED domain-containing protein RICESLEEPER 2-like [Pistacia vera]